jgi:hypothetical protein
VVQVTNFDAGIEERVKAIREDFLDTGGIRAAVLAATERLLAELQRTGRIPMAPQRRSSPHGYVKLTLNTIGRAGTGSDLTKWDQVYQYEVRGLPSGEQAWIANFGSRYKESWRILRARNGVQSDWTGEYQSAEAALAELQREYE